MSLPKWPPEVDNQSQQALIHVATDWTLSHSLILRPNPPDLTSAVHGPFALYPTPFPRVLFEKAVLLERAYNDLYMNLASDEAFLQRVIGQVVAKVDSFQGGLWKIWEQVKEEGISQDLTLGIFRSDYLLHSPELTSNWDIRQVEFNTISSSFGPLANKVSDLHRYLTLSGAYASAHLRAESIPKNNALVRLTAGLAQAHKAYGSPRYVPREGL